MKYCYHADTLAYMFNYDEGDEITRTSLLSFALANFDCDESKVMTIDLPDDITPWAAQVKVDENGNHYVGETDNFEIKYTIELLVLRAQRNKLLADSDWINGADVNLSPEKKEEWQVYRQKLRDLTSTTDPKNPVFPTPPQ